jgi:uncharacterized protein YfiM (DUF2279 family)
MLCLLNHNGQFAFPNYGQHKQLTRDTRCRARVLDFQIGRAVAKRSYDSTNGSSLNLLLAFFEESGVQLGSTLINLNRSQR